VVEQVTDGVALAGRGLVEDAVRHGFHDVHHAQGGGLAVERCGHHS
jgi:hypothetical protein